MQILSPFCMQLGYSQTEYGLTFPSLLSWLYAVEDDRADLQYLNEAGDNTAQQRLLGEASTL